MFRKRKLRRLLAADISVLGLNNRSMWVLGESHKHGRKFETVGDITACTEGDLLAVWNCGAKTLADVEKCLAAKGLSLRP